MCESSVSLSVPALASSSLDRKAHDIQVDALHGRNHVERVREAAHQCGPRRNQGCLCCITLAARRALLLSLCAFARLRHERLRFCEGELVPMLHQDRGVCCRFFPLDLLCGSCLPPTHNAAHAARTAHSPSSDPRTLSQPLVAAQMYQVRVVGVGVCVVDLRGVRIDRGKPLSCVCVYVVCVCLSHMCLVLCVCFLMYAYKCDV